MSKNMRKRKAKILITAGPTWVKVDAVRILTNIFTGRTGLYLAQRLKNKGFSVTLLVNDYHLGKISGLKIDTFRYFEELSKKIKGLLKNNRYRVIIHTAAVSDYVLTPRRGKVPSQKNDLILKLKPAEKIIKTMRKMAPQSILFQFKLETGRQKLIKRALESMRKNRSDYVIANALSDLHTKYKSFIITKDGSIIRVSSKEELADKIAKLIIANL